MAFLIGTLGKHGDVARTHGLKSTCLWRAADSAASGEGDTKQRLSGTIAVNPLSRST